MDTHHGQVGFMLRMQGWFTYEDQCNTPSNRINGEKHITSTDAEKASDKKSARYRDKDTQQTRNRRELCQPDKRYL